LIDLVDQILFIRARKNGKKEYVVAPIVLVRILKTSKRQRCEFLKQQGFVVDVHIPDEIPA